MTRAPVLGDAATTGPSAAVPAAGRQRLAPRRARRPPARRSPHTCSAIPSEAVSPVERIAATLMSRAARARGPDHVVAPAARRAQAGVGGDRLGAVERGQHRAPPSARISSAASGAHRPVAPCPPGRPRWARRRPCRRWSGTRARPWCAWWAPAAGSARVDGVAGRRRGTRPCAGRSRSSRRRRRRATSSARRPGAVDARRRSASPVASLQASTLAPLDGLDAGAGAAARRAVLAAPRRPARACRRPGRSPTRPGPRARRRRPAPP